MKIIVEHEKAMTELGKLFGGMVLSPTRQAGFNSVVIELFGPIKSGKTTFALGLIDKSLADEFPDLRAHRTLLGWQSPENQDYLHRYRDFGFGFAALIRKEFVGRPADPDVYWHLQLNPSVGTKFKSRKYLAIGGVDIFEHPPEILSDDKNCLVTVTVSPYDHVNEYSERVQNLLVYTEDHPVIISFREAKKLLVPDNPQRILTIIPGPLCTNPENEPVRGFMSNLQSYIENNCHEIGCSLV